MATKTNSKKYLKKGIDVSHWQGDIDWKKVKESGIEFAMIKLGGAKSETGEYYVDEKFNDNYKKAKAAGVSVGAYWYVNSKFLTIAEGRKQAEYVISKLKGKYFDYPIAVDVETTAKSNKEQATVATIVFCDTLFEAGFYPTIYASDISGFKERLNLDRLIRFDKWVARYGADNLPTKTSAPSYVTTYEMWQYSSNGAIAGISGRVDLDYAYKDYSEFIKLYGYNGYKGKLQNESRVTLETVVNEVIQGLWGEGNDLRHNLTTAGYVYNEIKRLVDETYCPPEYCED